jgi:hypothetical protein
MSPSMPVRNVRWTARLGALCYVVWGLFHVEVAHDIYVLGSAQTGIAQGRLYQLAAYLLCIALFAIVVAVVANWRNTQQGYWLNLCVIGWADGVWVAVVVLPGYVPILRGLIPPAIFLMGAVLTSIARRGAREFLI